MKNIKCREFICYVLGQICRDMDGFLDGLKFYQYSRNKGWSKQLLPNDDQKDLFVYKIPSNSN